MEAYRNEHLGLEVGYATEKGRRAANEDVAVVTLLDNGLFLGVIDGAGGHKCGEIAAREVAAGLSEYYASFRDGTVKNAGIFANKKMLAYFAEFGVREDGTDPGVPGAVGVWGRTKKDENHHNRHILTAGHLGDSRTYSILPGGASLLTSDQNFPGRQNVVMDGCAFYTGFNPAMISEQVIFLVPGTYAMLCSDGILAKGKSQLISEEEIARIACGQEPIEEKCRIMCQAALDRGSTDNVTVALLHML